MTILSGAEFPLEDFSAYFIQLWLTWSHQSFVFLDRFLSALLSVSVSGLCGPIAQEAILCVFIALPFIKLNSTSNSSWSWLSGISRKVTAACPGLRRRQRSNANMEKGDFWRAPTSCERTHAIRFIDVGTNTHTVALKIERSAVEDNKRLWFSRGVNSEMADLTQHGV